MHATDLGEAFKAIMAARGWTQAQLGHELGRDQPWVSKVIGGRKDPRARDVSRFLAKVGWEMRLTPISGGEDDPVKRRDFVAASASAFFVPTPNLIPYQDPNFVRLLTKKTVQAHYHVGGNSLAAILPDQARKITAASGGGGRELHAAISDFMRWGTYALRQGGRSDIAGRFASGAVGYARRAADPDRQALALNALLDVTDFNNPTVSLSTSGRDGGRAVMVARQALGIDGIGDEPRAHLNAKLACGLASVPGGEREARAALERALSIDTLSAIDRVDIIGVAGNALRDMGERRKALTMLEDAVRQSSTHSEFHQAVYLCDQIMVALATRQPDLAASRMNGLSYIAPLINSRRVAGQVDAVLRAAKPWETVSTVREARGRLQSVRPVSEDSRRG